MTKYNAKPTVVDGIRFDSQAEAARYGELRLLEQAGKIRDLRIHRRFELIPAFTTNMGRRVRAVSYESDFTYYESGYKALVVEDVKGVRTSVYVVKRALFLQRFPEYDFREVRVA